MKIRFKAMVLSSVLAFVGLGPAGAEDVVRIGLTISDIPTTRGQPDQGSQGVMWMGLTLFDPLVTFDLTVKDRPADIAPGLATEWSANPKEPNIWTFKLRNDVKFHDGSKFNADAVIWNLDKLFKKDSPQYDERQVAQVIWRMPSVSAYRKVGEYEIEIQTKEPDGFLPYQLTYTYFSSPAQWEKVGRNWEAFAKSPSGTGPWKLDRLVPRERAELIVNKEYWDVKRRPQIDRLVLLPIPEATTRVAALLSGQVDWIENVPPDAIPRLEAAGYKIYSNAYPHVWPYLLSWLPDAPTKDVRVRQALNLAINREGIVKLLRGYAVPARGHVLPNSPWFGKPTFNVRHDPAEAKRLLAEAGYGPNNPLRLTFLTATAGGGQMQPLPMNEFIQQNLREVGVELKLVVDEWETMRSRGQKGAADPGNKGIHGINWSWGTFDPFSAFTRFFDSTVTPPRGQNWGHIKDDRIDQLLREAQRETDPKKLEQTLQRLHERIVDLAAWVWVVHDVDPRALSPKIEGWSPAQSWLQEFGSVRLKK
jgi:peptide/nickel transport system substrate-binding protein